MENSEMLKFATLIENDVLSKIVLGEDFYFSVDFEVREDHKTIKFSCNKHRIHLEIKLSLRDPISGKLSNRLKYYIKKKTDGKYDAFNKTSQYGSRREFSFAFREYDEFLEFYKKYLI